MSCKHYPKWNAYTCPSKYQGVPTHVHQNIRAFWNSAETKIHVNRTCFTPVWNLKPVWVHFASHVNVLLISKLIVALNPYKSHVHDGWPIRILQMGSDSKPLSIMFRNCLKAGYFPTAWKKANVVPCPQILNNYRPVFFLPICSRFFEKIIFDTIFQHLTVSKLLNPNQSAFMPGDSCIHRFILIAHEWNKWKWKMNEPMNGKCPWIQIHLNKLKI